MILLSRAGFGIDKGSLGLGGAVLLSEQPIGHGSSSEFGPERGFIGLPPHVPLVPEPDGSGLACSP